MPQLARMTSQIGRVLNFKWPYHATVIKIFEQVSSTIGSQRDWSREFIMLRIEIKKGVTWVNAEFYTWRGCGPKLCALVRPCLPSLRPNRVECRELRPA